LTLASRAFSDQGKWKTGMMKKELLLDIRVSASVSNFYMTCENRGGVYLT
jgi:hypothetical protein